MQNCMPAPKRRRIPRARSASVASRGSLGDSDCPSSPCEPNPKRPGPRSSDGERSLRVRDALVPTTAVPVRVAGELLVSGDTPALTAGGGSAVEVAAVAVATTEERSVSACSAAEKQTAGDEKVQGYRMLRERLFPAGTSKSRPAAVPTASSGPTDSSVGVVGVADTDDETQHALAELDAATAVIQQVAIGDVPQATAQALIQSANAVNRIFRRLLRNMDFLRGQRSVAPQQLKNNAGLASLS